MEEDKEFDFKMITLDEVVTGTVWLDLIDKLELSIDEKMKTVVTAIECPAEYLILFDELIKLIHGSLQNRFKTYDVQACGFGSVVTGLALKHCDLDLYVRFDPSLGSEIKTLNKVKNCFYGREFSDVFTRVMSIKARVPILRCDHLIGFQCDVSVSNPLARFNSELVKFYISLNEKFRDFFMLAKLWMKRNCSLGVNKIKSYTLALLLIYYLQQRDLAPSVKCLQTSPQSPQPRVIAGWNSSFLNDKNEFGCIAECNLSLLQLLEGFFRFYSEFEFGFYVISPFLGQKVLKPFKQNSQLLLDNEAMKNLKETFVSVQDVFQLNYNTSECVTRHILLEFQNDCRIAVEKCQSLMANNSTPLKTLFTAKEEKKKAKKRKLGYNETLELCAERCPEDGSTEEEKRDEWVKLILQSVKRVITKIALADVINESDGVFQCQTRFPAYNKKLRSEMARAANVVEDDCADEKVNPAESTTEENITAQETPSNEESYYWSPVLCRHETISSAIAANRMFVLNRPLEFSINHSLSLKPTRIKLWFSCQRDEHSFVGLSQLNGQIMRWLCLINSN